MATAPYFVLSPNTVLSILGLARGPDKTVPTPPEDWRTARVDVVIPALNEAPHIALCLASVIRQTLRPRRIMLVDDGSTDATVEVAEAFCRFHNVDLITIRRRAPIGKTPTVKRQARELDSDVEFILDADTVLESDNYIARTVEEVYKAGGIAAACGTILPLRKRDRHAWLEREQVRTFAQSFPRPPFLEDHRWRDFLTGTTNLYREVLYLYLQRFIYRGQNVFFGTITNPVGCAVAYRRKYVEDLFGHFGPRLGDDLTNSEDIFIGLAMLDKGYRNTQLTDVYARTVEPPVHRLPRQVYLWSSSFLQSCYYFDPLLKSPLKAIRRAISRRMIPDDLRPPVPVAAAAAAGAGQGGMFSTALPGLWPSGVASYPTRRRTETSGDSGERKNAPVSSRSGDERRRIAEPYRQAFGRERTVAYGRPAGWMLMMSAVEKVFFPTTLLILIILRNWEGLIVTVAAETAVGVAALMVVMKGQRLAYLAKGLLVAPIRYALLMSELFTIGRFAVDLWISKDRNWRK
ncbi:MAG: glycosyltransferase family 2 protein [Vicinamibacterales bacterium]